MSQVNGDQDVSVQCLEGGVFDTPVWPNATKTDWTENIDGGDVVRKVVSKKHAWPSNY